MDSIIDKREVSRMIEKPIIFNFFNYKEPFLGSYYGMRYRIEKLNKDQENSLKITHWPEPFCYEATPQEETTIANFDFTECGYDKAMEWLNDEYNKYKKSE